MLRTGDVVLGLVEGTVDAVAGADERVAADLVGGELPEHAASVALVHDVLRLGLDDSRGVVGDELALGRVVRVRGDVGHVLVDGSAGEGKGLVRVDASLDGAGANLCAIV